MARQIGRYTIVNELGRGGMGVVYKAWEESLQRHVAIKMLADQYSDDESVVARFMREARAVADVHHANIVQVFCVDTHDGQPYFVMEYVEGESLGDCIRRESKVHPRKAVSLLREAASGLSAAHARGVVHRDIKPANLMLSRHGGLKVVDFGIARVESPDTKLTATGMAMGTPAYLSPEVCLAKSVDQRSDIFSLGVVLYEMLTGETPFNADSPLELMSKVVEARIPDLVELDGEIDPQLYSVLKVMLASEPHNRYSDCQQLIADLDDYLAGQSPRHASTVAAPPSAAVADDNEATVAMSTPAEGQLEKPRQPPKPAAKAPSASARVQPKKSSGGRLFLLAAMVGVVLLGTVSAASWWALQHYSVPLPGFSQRPAAEPSVDSAAQEQIAAAPVEIRSDRAGELVDPAVSSERGLPLPLAEQQVGDQEYRSQDSPSRQADTLAHSGPADGREGDSGQADTSDSREAESDSVAMADPERPRSSTEPSVAEARGTESHVTESQAPVQAEPDQIGEGLVGDERIAAASPPVVSPEQRPSESAPESRPVPETTRSEPAPQPSWDRSNPRLAVVVAGDRLGAAPLQAGVERMLADAGYSLFDADLVDLPAGGGLAGFSRALRGGGADIMVFVEIEPAGQSQLSYYGRQDTLYMANVSLRIVQLHDNESLAPMWQDSMRYTELNAEQKAREMVTPVVNQVLRSLRRL